MTWLDEEDMYHYCTHIFHLSNFVTQILQNILRHFQQLILCLQFQYENLGNLHKKMAQGLFNKCQKSVLYSYFGQKI